MTEYILTKRYLNHFGLDLKSSDLTRPLEYASGIKNAQYRKSGAIEKRRGYQACASSQGGHGLFTYNKADTTTGIQTSQVLSVSNKLHKLEESTLTVSYTGASNSVVISIYYDTVTDQYRCLIVDGVTTLLDMALGVGFDEASTITINDLKLAIDALADITAVLSGSTSTPAAFIGVVRDYNLSESDLVAKACYWSDCNSPVATPFAGSETNKNSDDFENVSSVQINNITLISNGYDEVQKWDGQNCYRAGLPTPTSISTVDSGAGAITGSNYTHVIQYLQKDAVGNIVEGNILKSTALAPLVAKQVTATIANIQASSGFNTNCAIVNGAQAVVTTITVDDGSGGSHTMKVGDTAYFYDGVSSSYVERLVTAIGATTITIAGAAVTIADNAVVSNNLRISLFRSKTSGTAPTIFYLIAEIPNNSFVATQTYLDNLTDAQLGAQLIEPITDRSPPPKGKYISIFRNISVIAGSREFPNTVFYSDVDSPEYFPSDITQFDVHTVAGDIITGIAPINELFAIFKNRSIFEVTGDISSNNIRVNQITSDIGCSAHHSIQDIRGTLCFLSDRGPYQMRGGEIPTPLGNNRLEPIFDDDKLTQEIKQILFDTQLTSDDERFKLKRAISINDRKEEKYILYLPTESESGVNKYANTQSKTIVFDYSRGAWLLWDSLNMAGGATIANDEFYFTERRLSSYTTNVDHILYRRHTIADAYAYQDNTLPIDWGYDTQWESLEEPSVLKRFLRLKVFNLEELPNNSMDLSVETEADFIREVPKSSFVLSLTEDGYGVSEYGVAPYGDVAFPTSKYKLQGGRYRSLRVRFSNNEDQRNIVLSGWELEIVTAYRKAFKR
jgi:hypothetical protein